jgi:hypothetical protein
VIVHDDKDRQPFKVECRGSTHFYEEGDVELAEELGDGMLGAFSGFFGAMPSW